MLLLLLLFVCLFVCVVCVVCLFVLFVCLFVCLFVLCVCVFVVVDIEDGSTEDVKHVVSSTRIQQAAETTVGGGAGNHWQTLGFEIVLQSFSAPQRY